MRVDKAGRPKRLVDEDEVDDDVWNRMPDQPVKW